MKRLLAPALCLLLLACHGASSNELYRETTVSATDAEGALASWNAAREWLEKHDFELRESPDADAARYVKKSRQDEVITLVRDSSEPNLVRIRIDVTHGLHPTVALEYSELGEVATAAATQKR